MKIPLLSALAIVWLICAAVNTIDKRLHQARKAGLLPPDQPMLPMWINWSWIAQYVVLGVILWKDWRFGVALYVITFILAITPILEFAGNVICAPFRWRMKPSGTSNGSMVAQEETVEEQNARWKRRPRPSPHPINPM